MLDGREVLLLCSNDYLGLAGDPRVREAAAAYAARAGAPGAGASPLVSGNMAPHRELAARLAELKGTEACVLFGSGFLANTGVIAALATDGVVASRRAATTPRSSTAAGSRGRRRACIRTARSRAAPT